ncbi:kinesin-like protein costa [Hetaerina americana]|uniref:kinesin-like protein costa n=1 Tax=Hetaerina americana TaxID=62018 RepID=UPI003A7F227C
MFLEIHEDVICDLLNTSQFQPEITVSEDQHGGAIINGAEEAVCQNIMEVFNCIHIGMSNRHTNVSSVTSLNRCHTIFILTLDQQWEVGNGMIQHRTSKMVFADLVGPERTYSSQGTGNWYPGIVRMDPGLTAMANVVSILSDSSWQNNKTPVPYMESNLTKVLRDSFGGNARTLFVCCLSPASLDFDESLNSLRYSARVQNIVNHSLMNVCIYSHQIKGIHPNCSTNSRLTVGNKSTNDVIFGLEFAALQWMKLVSNAEGLFKKMVLNESLNAEEKEQIQLWLCLKQECDECVGRDESLLLGENEEVPNRFLGKIDELTESGEKTDATGDVNQNTCISATRNGMFSGDSNQDLSQYASEDESDLNAQTPDFLDKLDEYMKVFKEKTDSFIWDTIESHQFDISDELFPMSASVEKEEVVRRSNSSSDDLLAKLRSPLGLPQLNSLSARRHCIHPGAVDAEMRNITKALAKNELRESLPTCVNLLSNEGSTHEKEGNNAEERNSPSLLDAGPSSEARALVVFNVKDTASHETPDGDIYGPMKELKLLAANKEAHQNQIRQILLDLQGAQRRIEELQNTICIKEQFIADMIKNSETRASAKHRFERKIRKLEVDFFQAKVKLAQAEKSYGQATKGSTRGVSKEDEMKFKKDVEKYKKLADRYEQRLRDIVNIKQLAGDSAKKVLELEHSLQSSKRQMEKLKKQLQKEEKNKQCLEQELMEDQKKIKDLEQKYADQTHLLSKKVSAEMVEEDRLKWIQEEEERIVSMRESSKRIQEQLLQQQSMLEKRETFLKEKLALDKQKSKSLHKVSARILHLDDVMKEKSSHMEKTANQDEKEALRHEIQNLRRTRDCLTNQRYKLDEKYQKEKTLTSAEERKLLELDEALEAIDAAIEYKNELICGREDKLGCVKKTGIEDEDLLMARLMSLSPMETRTLLYKYFQRVIDLREGGRKMEVQIAVLDSLTETQSWKIHVLNNALQQAHDEMDQRIVVIQKEHQERLHLLLRHFAEESSGGSGADSSALWDVKNQLAKSKRENKYLRRRILEVESALQMTDGAYETRALHLESAAPQHSLIKRLQAPGTINVPTTKVTRERNKLIIQQQKPNRS